MALYLCLCCQLYHCLPKIQFSICVSHYYGIYPPKWKYMFVCLLFSSTYLHTLESSSKGRNSIKYFSTIRGVLVKIYVKFNFNTLINHIACFKKMKILDLICFKILTCYCTLKENVLAYSKSTHLASIWLYSNVSLKSSHPQLSWQHTVFRLKDTHTYM